MNKVFTFITSLLLVYSLLFFTCVPAFASETNLGQVNSSDGVQREIETINDFIRLIREAKIAGDAETVAFYEDLLAKLGIEHVDGEEILTHLEQAGITLMNPEYSVNAALPVVSDTANVDWYVGDMKGYYYPRDSHYYDVYMIMATPKNPSSVLYTANVIRPADPFNGLIENAGNVLYEQAVSFIVDEIDHPIFTFLEIISGLLTGISPQHVETISANDWTLQSSSYSTFTYIYIRNASSTDDYQIAMCGNEVELNYGYLQEVFVTTTDGITRSTMASKVNNQVIYSKGDYADIGVAIDTFKKNICKLNIIYSIEVDIFTVDGVPRDTASIPVADWISNPNYIHGESDQGDAVQ